MRGERSADREALMNRYGLSARLAARVAALLARKVDITETLLEMAGSDAALEAFLLDRSLLMDTQTLDEERLHALARERGFGDWELLRLLRAEDGWRTIALEDDVLAEQAEGSGGEAGALVRPTGSGISRPETAELFTPEEIARLKLAALTSQELDERTEALRKLVFAPLPAAQKAGIFVTVLVDAAADVRVRREAARALEHIGFRSELAEAVRRLFDPELEDVLYAVRRLGALLEEAEEGEVGVALAVVLGAVEEEERRPVVQELLRLTARTASVLTKSRQKTEQFIRATLRHLSRDFDALWHEVAQALSAIYGEAPETAEEVLWEEVARSTEPRVRAFLIHLLGPRAREPDRRLKVAQLAIEAILDAAVPEEQRSHLRYGLVRLGELAARVLLERIRAEPQQVVPELVRLLDVVCTEGEVSRQTVNESVRRGVHRGGGLEADRQRIRASNAGGAPGQPEDDQTQGA